MKNLISIPGLLSFIQRYQFELILCLAMTSLGIVYSLFPTLRTSLQNFYFVPVVVSSMLLGWKKSSAFTVVGVSLVLCVSCSTWSDHTPQEFLNLVFWGCTLGTTGAIIGLAVATRERQVTELLEKQNSLAHTDPLTQIANRRAFDLELRRRMSEQVRYDRSLSVLMIDIDYFKKFNDRYGHSVGDLVLQTIANAIQESLRESDFVARLGGEEFAVLLPETNRPEALVVAEQIRLAVDQASESEAGCPQEVSVSIGVTEVDALDDGNSVMERADLAMYSAKREGRNQVFSVDFETQNENRNAFQELNAPVLPEPILDPKGTLKGSEDAGIGLTCPTIFDDELSRRIYESSRYGMELCLGIIEIGYRDDLDETDAKVCQQVEKLGRTICLALRQCDLITWQTELEFGVLLPFTAVEDAEGVLRRLFLEINTDMILEDQELLLHIQSIRVIQHQAGETKQQVLSHLHSAVPVNESGRWDAVIS
ncbi:MAG: GGDEF domain-containing protein [Planctomycetota bacterium]|nr:GGDEF domain-containing protein [Planctomycetota bacterium]